MLFVVLLCFGIWLLLCWPFGVFGVWYWLLIVECCLSCVVCCLLFVVCCVVSCCLVFGVLCMVFW